MALQESPSPKDAPVDRPSEPLSRSEWRRLILLLAGVLCAHLLVAWMSRGGAIRDDAVSYVLLARNLVEGHGFVFEPGQAPTSWRAPGYVAYLSGIFWLTGGSVQAARFGHAFLWVLMTLCVFLLARKTVGPRAAFWAAGLAGFYPEFLGFSGLIWSENLFLCLFAATLYGFSFVGERRSWLLYAGVGVLFGCAILTRSTTLALFPALWYLAALRGRKPEAFTQAALVTVVALAVMGSWTYRNWTVHHKFIPVESNLGFNLYVGYHPDTPIPFSWRKLDTVRQEPRFQELDSGKTEAESLAALKKAAKEQIRAQPSRAVGLMIGKTFDFWLPDFFIARNVHSGAFGSAYRPFWIPVLAVTVLASLCIYLLALLFYVKKGGVRSADWYPRVFLLILILYTLPHTLVYGASRYRLPLMLLLILLGSKVLQEGYDRIRSRSQG
jgi:4-amino-4-deoxy-L-arabinose transferase-like glycosyltransferase